MTLDKLVTKEENKKKSIFQKVRNSIGATCLTVLTAFASPVFSSGCINHDLEKPFVPDSGLFLDTEPQLPKPVNANELDGHYNVKTENTKILIKNESSEFYPVETHDTVHKNVDFRSFDDKNGTLMFGYDGVFCWMDPPITIDDQGNFNTIIKPRAQWFLTGYIGCKLQIKGNLSNNKLTAEAIETFYMGNVLDKLHPVSISEYDLDGNKRFKPNVTRAKKIEGEYKTITTKFSNTCQFQTLPNGDYFFPITIINQGKDDKGRDVIDFNIEDLLYLPGASFNPNENINFVYKNGDHNYILKGTLDSEKIDLNVTLDFKFSDGYTCSQKYEMHGLKRFEEADGSENNFDGIYSILVDMEDNTCTDETYSKRRHLDVIKTEDKTFSLKLGSMEFNPTLDPEGNFLETYENHWGDRIYTIKGNLNSNKLTAKVSETLKYNDCYYLHNIKGVKLYKSNKNE